MTRPPTEETTLTAADLSLGYRGAPVVDRVSVTLRPGRSR